MSIEKIRTCFEKFKEAFEPSLNEACGVNIMARITVEEDVNLVLDPVNDLFVELKNRISELEETIRGLETENAMLENQISEME